MDKVFVRNPYNYDRDAASIETGLACDPATDMAVQSQKDDADINVILERFGVTGQVPQNLRTPLVGDFDEFDFKLAMNTMALGKTAFLQLPAKVRERFANNPEAFVEFCLNPENVDEARKLGLAIAKPGDAGGNSSAGNGGGVEK